MAKLIKLFLTLALFVSLGKNLSAEPDPSKTFKIVALVHDLFIFFAELEPDPLYRAWEMELTRQIQLHNRFISDGISSVELTELNRLQGQLGFYLSPRLDEFSRRWEETFASSSMMLSILNWNVYDMVFKFPAGKRGRITYEPYSKRRGLSLQLLAFQAYVALIDQYQWSILVEKHQSEFRLAFGQIRHVFALNFPDQLVSRNPIGSEPIYDASAFKRDSFVYRLVNTDQQRKTFLAFARSELKNMQAAVGSLSNCRPKFKSE